jgi:hypothetical protein
VYSKAPWAGHEAKRLNSKLKRIDARGGPAGTVEPTDAGSNWVCYSLLTMSAINGDKARFHRQRKHKLAKRERNRALRKKFETSSPTRRPDGRDL